MCNWLKSIGDWKSIGKKIFKIFFQIFPIDFIVVNHVLWVNSIENVKSQLQTSKVNCKLQNLNTILGKIAISVCFCCCSAGKRREIGTMNLQIHATLRYWTFSSKGNVHKSSFGLCSLAPGPINLNKTSLNLTT